MDQDFRDAQWRVPYGWHVEGQVLPLRSGWVAAATWTAPNRNAPEKGTVVYAIGYTPALALANLSRRFYDHKRMLDWRSISAPEPLRTLGLVLLPNLLEELGEIKHEMAALGVR